MTAYHLAVITDVHADVHAIRDALAQIDAMGCDAIVCAGDTVDYGLFPNETLALLAERAIPTVRGNHDRWAIDGDFRSGSSDLSIASRRFLRATIHSWSMRHDGVRVVVCHARHRSDMNGIYPNSPTAELASQLDLAEADVLVVGHTHIPFARFVDRRLVCNPGALLRDPASPMADAMLYDLASGRFVPSPSERCGGTFGVLELPTLRFTVHRAKDGVEVVLRANATLKP